MSDDKYKEIDKVLTRIRGEFEDYAIITPLNLEEEFEKFLAHNKNYDPILEYEEIETDDIVDELKSLKIDTSEKIGKLFEEIRTYLLKFAAQIDLSGTDKFHTTHLFEPISEETLKSAKEMIKKELPPKEDREKNISYRVLGEVLIKELEKYEITDWHVRIKQHMGSTVSVNGVKKIISVKKGNFYSKEHIKKLLVHEVGTHVLRAENGQLQKYQIFASGLPRYLGTEEGIASYNEYTQKVSSEHILKRLARNVLLTKIAGEGSFMDVYNFARPFYDEGKDGDRKAFRMCVRIKRGMGDTSKPGGFLKDHSYYQGFLRVKKYAKEGGDIKKLYAGKIGLQHMWLVDEGIIKPAQLLPNFLK